MVNPYEVGAIVTVIVATALAIWYLLPVMTKKPVTGAESLVGAKGTVYSDTLSPVGEVSIQGVIWRARLVNPELGSPKKGDEIVVTSVDDITLIVNRPSQPRYS